MYIIKYDFCPTFLNYSQEWMFSLCILNIILGNTSYKFAITCSTISLFIYVKAKIGNLLCICYVLVYRISSYISCSTAI